MQKSGLRGDERERIKGKFPSEQASKYAKNTNSVGGRTFGVGREFVIGARGRMPQCAQRKVHAHRPVGGNSPLLGFLKDLGDVQEERQVFALALRVSSREGDQTPLDASDAERILRDLVPDLHPFEFAGKVFDDELRRREEGDGDRICVFKFVLKVEKHLS